MTYKSRKKEQIMVPLEDEIDDEKSYETIDIISRERSPEEETADNDLGLLIGNALDSLTTRQRITFVLKHYEGYKIREIAEMLNCKEGTVKKYLFDAVKNLKKKLKPLNALQS